MSKRLAVLSLVGALWLAGCVSHSWTGMPPQEAAEWKGLGVSAHGANRLRKNGFAPGDVKPWLQFGIQDPDTIVSWHREGFTPQETAKWTAWGSTLPRAIELRKRGLTIH